MRTPTGLIGPEGEDEDDTVRDTQEPKEPMAFHADEAAANQRPQA